MPLWQRKSDNTENNQLEKGKNHGTIQRKGN